MKFLILMLRKCYGDDCLSKSQFFKWYKTFGGDREAVEPHSESPLTSYTQYIYI